MRLNQLSFLIGEGLRGMLRHRGLTIAALLASIATYSILTTFLLVSTNVRRAVTDVAARKEVVVFIRDSVPDDSIRVLYKMLSGVNGVQSIRYLSKEQALAEFKNELGEAQDLVEAVGANPLPRSLRLTLKPEAREALRLAAIADTISQFSGVEDVRYGEQWVERLDVIVRRVRAGVLSAGALVACAALLILLATIRLAVVARRDLVQVFRMVGASGMFVRAPFVVEGVVSSVLAMALALLAAWGLKRALQQWIPGVIFLNIRGIVGALLFALLIGLVGSLFALGNVLRSIKPSK
jgi:cell division transport system permease protein